VKFLCIGLLLAFSTSAVSAADLFNSEHPRTKRAWIRRATLAAGCAASLVFDTWSTRRATAAGAVETNGLFANSQGQPQWGHMIAIKAGACGVSALVEETHLFHSWRSPAADWTWTGINAGTAGVYSWAGWHNLRLAQKP
jgi:hypothetical protein